MEPSESIRIVEVDLRDLIESVLRGKHGDDWLEKAGLDEERVRGLTERREEERKSRSPAGVDERLIAYSHLYELRSVIHKNWDLFKPIFGEKKLFDVYLDRLEDFRNAPAHSRDLLPYERDLLAGIAGEIRNRVTTFRSTLDPDQQYYPRIELVTDSFGNRVESPDVTRPWVEVQTGLSRPPGQEIQFRGRGWDPQGRTLTWGLGNVDIVVFASAEGTEALLDYTVTEEEVREAMILSVSMASDGKYHRWSRWDQRVFFGYKVLPPE